MTTFIAYLIVALTVVRLCVAWAAPLAFDEAYYWLWSRNLAAGYYDHPGMVALLIRASTAIFGETPFGIRALSVLLGLPASWAVWRATVALYGDEWLGAVATLFFNLTLFAAAGTVIVTPDTPLFIASAFVLLFLAKVLQDRAGWLAVGAAVGLALGSKFTALFFGPSILLWLVWVPQLRRWLVTPWPYLGGLVALLLVAPALAWNAEHDWISFLKQGGRVGLRGDFTLRYLGEHLAAQFGMLTPGVCILGMMGLLAFLRGQGGALPARALLGALVWPLAIYLLWHSLHSRVEGNWTSLIIPPIAVAAAVAGDKIEWHGRLAQVAGWSRKLAAPVALGLASLAYLQALFGVIPLGSIDPTARQLGVGWPALAAQIDGLRREAGAAVVLGSNYGTVAWLSFYLPSRPLVVQINERIRWVNMPEPDASLLKGPLLYVCKAPCAMIAPQKFERVTELQTLPRMRRGVTIDNYLVWRLDGLKGDLLDRNPPPELQGRVSRKAAAPDR